MGKNLKNILWTVSGSVLCYQNSYCEIYKPWVIASWWDTVTLGEYYQKAQGSYVTSKVQRLKGFQGWWPLCAVVVPTQSCFSLSRLMSQTQSDLETCHSACGSHMTSVSCHCFVSFLKGQLIWYWVTFIVSQESCQYEPKTNVTSQGEWTFHFLKSI